MAAQGSASRSELRERRIDELLDGCRDQVLQQIIGPFGLTPAMFNTKEGGDVTTQHNAEKDIYANSYEEYNAREYKGRFYRQTRKRKLADESVDERVKDAYTGRFIDKAETDMDDTIPAHKSHQMGGWQKSAEERAEIGGDPRNLNFTNLSANRSKSDRDMSEWMAEGNKDKYGLDGRRVNPRLKKAEKAINSHMPDLMERTQYDAKALAKTGATAAATNALRQATGMVLHELVSGSYVEIRRLTKEPNLQEEFVDHLIQSIKNVASRIQGKLKKIFEAIVTGGIQGFLSNLLTYIINKIWTTAAKVVTVIREGMKDLWQAIKLMVNPPQGMSGIEVAREVAKIIAGVVTMALGIAFEKSVETFILSIPIFAPFADTIAPALTAILTGVATALVIYGIDRMFDWLNDNGTEILEAQMANLEASAAVVDKMVSMLNAQFNNSSHYQLCIQNYTEIETNLSRSATSLDWSIHHAEVSIHSLTSTIKTCEEQFPALNQMDDELHKLLNNDVIENCGDNNG